MSKIKKYYNFPWSKYCLIIITFHFFAVIVIFGLGIAENSLDTREGENLTLRCRFTHQQVDNGFSYYWARWTSALNFDNVAIGDVLLSAGYK